MMSRPHLPNHLKLSYYICAAVHPETGEMLEDLAIMTKRSIGSLTREALEMMIAQRKTEIRKWRKQCDAVEVEAAE
jgi:hypothetical protein